MAAGRARPTDAHFMGRALALGARGLGRTWPNPPVGAVLVRGGRVVGEGFHTRAGAPHAEIKALRAAGASEADLTIMFKDNPAYLVKLPALGGGAAPRQR